MNKDVSEKQLSDGKPHDELKVLSSEGTPHKAIILVGGIHNNYTYFDTWKESLAGKDTAVMGFNHDHQSENMKTGAHNLAQAIRELKSQGFDEVQVVAHSMGGLVSKGALNELVASGEAKDFKSLSLDAFGTPWGGFAMADAAAFIPGSETISNLIGYPMGPEMGPHSDYMKNLSQDWPKNMEFNVYSGSTDEVAHPNASSTKTRYEAITEHANNVIIMEGFKHPDYSEASPSVLQAKLGEHVPGLEQVSQSEPVKTSVPALDTVNTEAQPKTASNERSFDR